MSSRWRATTCRERRLEPNSRPPATGFGRPCVVFAHCRSATGIRNAALFKWSVGEREDSVGDGVGAFGVQEVAGVVHDLQFGAGVEAIGDALEEVGS